MDIQSNWEEYKAHLYATEREGVDELIKWMEKTDAPTAPASTKYHLCVKGGLIKHSLNTLNFAREINELLGTKIPEESLVLATLLHDLCKVNYYVEGEEWDKEHKDKTGQWRKMACWKIEDKLPLGHGEKSVIIANRYITLTGPEMLAIRWHMLKWDVSVEAQRTMGIATDKDPLVKITAMADQMAELYETLPNKDS